MSINASDICLNHCNAACCTNRNGNLGFKISDGSITLEQIRYMTDRCEQTSTGYKLLKGLLGRTTGIILNTGTCPFLYDNKCTIYNNPMRPTICNTLQPGQGYCNYAREASGQTRVSAIRFYGIT